MIIVWAWVIVLLAVNSVLMNQQYILSKVSLNGNTCKPRSYIGWLTKMWPEALFLYSSISSRASDSGFPDSLIQCSRPLENLTTALLVLGYTKSLGSLLPNLFYFLKQSLRCHTLEYNLNMCSLLCFDLCGASDQSRQWKYPSLQFFPCSFAVLPYPPFHGSAFSHYRLVFVF